MATRIQRVVFDDLDQTTEDVRAYRFALEGVEYEIDLADHNLVKLRAALHPFIAAGRRQSKSRTGTANPGTPSKNASPVRQWWHTHGARLGLPAFNSRGSIPRQVIAAFRNDTQS